MNSSMIVTEPLPAALWDTIGWDGRETLGDMAHAYVYAQRTADDRIALGGRGVPYRYASATDNDGRTQPATVEALRDLLVRFFPTTAGTRIDHAWSGVLGVPRDWCATVTLDRSTGLGWAGGYVGSGVATANLAARTLRDLIQQDSGRAGPTEFTTLPWVNHKVRRWEPEPSAGSASTPSTPPTAPPTAAKPPPPPSPRTPSRRRRTASPDATDRAGHRPGSRRPGSHCPKHHRPTSHRPGHRRPGSATDRYVTGPGRPPLCAAGDPS